MKKIILISALALSSATFAQVGVNTLTPKKTLHVNGSLQVVNELNFGGNATTAGSAGTVGQILVSSGPGSAPAWSSAVNASSNIYNTNGTLTGNRTVIQGANTLAFTGTAVNAFSVDGTTLSVDASNDRVGIGTASPQKAFHVNGALQVVNELNVGGNATTAGSAGTVGQILVSSGPGSAPAWSSAANASSNIYNTNGTLTGNRTVTQGANTLAFTGTAVNAFSVDGTTLSVDAANNRIGIGTTAPSNSLHINAGNDPLRIDGLQNASANSNELLTITSGGIIKKSPSLSTLSIPSPSVFYLANSISNALSGQQIGGTITLSMTVLKNQIPGLTYNGAGQITFPAGTYQLTMVYEATHNLTGCSLSSYFVDFPSGSRVHTTASHNEGNTSNHGGSVILTSSLSGTTTWNINLGRGQSGNCIGNGMTLAANSTQLTILRVGD